MHIQSIGIRNNQVNFKEIYIPKGAEFNEKQSAILSSIKSELTKPLPDFEGKTAEDFYKAQGIDFEIAPSEFWNDSVVLTGYHGVKEIGTGKDEAITYSDSVFIGEYDENSPFKVSDIRTQLNENANWHMGNTMILAVSAIGLLAVALITLFTNNPQKVKKSVKPLIENIDNNANKANAVLSDTTKIFENGIK